MERLNPNAWHSVRRGRPVFIEDIRDPDGRWYRLEYRCDDDGGNAAAWCRHNPWGRDPDGRSEHSHLARSDSLICVGHRTHRRLSGYDLEFVVLRARFWCTSYSYYREHGYEATCRVAPEWRGRSPKRIGGR